MSLFRFDALFHEKVLNRLSYCLNHIPTIAKEVLVKELRRPSEHEYT